MLLFSFQGDGNRAIGEKQMHADPENGSESDPRSIPTEGGDLVSIPLMIAAHCYGSIVSGSTVLEEF